MKKITQKALSLLLSFAMLFGMVQGAAVPVFAAGTDSVSIGGVTVADSSWYAKTDANGTVTECAETDDWNIHAVKDSGPPATATVTLKNATIENASGTQAIEASGYDLNIVLEGTANQIGTDENVYGYAIYSGTANNVSITGTGDLTLKGYYGINVSGSGAVKIDTTGSLSITSNQQMVYTGGSLTVSAKSITANGNELYCRETSLTATDGDIRVTGTNDYAISAGGSVTVAAPKGAVSLSGGQYAIYAGSKEVNASAKNDITITGTVYGGAVSISSVTGNVAINGYCKAIESATSSVAVSAPQGDVTLRTSSTSSCIISGSNSYPLSITAGGKLDVQSPDGIAGYSTADIRADTVQVALTGDGNGFSGGALTITNPSGGNCSAVSVSGGGGGRNTISAADLTIKADQVAIAAAADAANAIYANGNVSIGDAGLIVGAVSVKGTTYIASGVVQVSKNGGDASGGLDLYTTAKTPTQSTYYKAGDGYALFTPKNGETPAKLVLHNATINNTTKFIYQFGPEYEGIALPAEAVTLQVEGTNKIISYVGNGIGYGTNLTLSGDGTLTVEKTSCGISLNGSFAFADGAKVTLNSTVAATSHMSYTVSTVYGNVTVESTEELNQMHLDGAVTIAKGATLTVPKGQRLWMDKMGSITNNGTIINNGTILLPYNYTAKQVQDLNLPGSILLYDSDNDKYKAYVNGSFYAYGGVINGDLNLTTPPTEVTYYKAENGYFIFTPGTPAALTLHNVDTEPNIVLPNAPMTLYLEGTNKVIDIEASNAVTVSGSGTLDATIIRNSDSAAVPTVSSGAVLNAWYQTTDSNSITTDTYYGRYTLSDIHYQTVNANTKLVLAPGAVLTLAEDGHLLFSKDTPLNYLTIGAGASIVNNTYVTLPKGTTVEQIKALPLSGTGVVRVATTYDEYGWATSWDNYTNDGTAMNTVSGGLTLTDTEVPASEDKGYTWTKSGEGASEVWTLTLNRTCIDGTLTLPGKTVVIDTAADSFITGSITSTSGCNLSLTFKGSGSLKANRIGGAADGDTVTVAEGANVTVTGGASIGPSGNTGGKLTVNGTLTASNENSSAILVGQAEIGSSGVLNISGEAGLKLCGKKDENTGATVYTNAFVIKKGGQLNANCDRENVTVFTNTTKAETGNAAGVIVLPDGYLPDGYEVAVVSGNNGGMQYAYTIAAKGAKLALISEQVAGTGAGGKLTLTKPAATVSGVTVTPSAVSVQKGNSQTFSAVVTGNNEPSQTVTWSVEGGKSQSTVIEGNGKLTVAADETASTLTVKATSTANTAKYGTATVTVTGSGNPDNPTNPTNPTDPTDNSGKNSNSSSDSSLPSVLTDAATNVTVDLTGASFPSSVTSITLSVIPVARNSVTDPQGAALYPASEADAKLNVIGTSAVYNIRLLDRSGSAITGFTGTVRVSVPLPSGLRGTPRVFRYEANGTFADKNAAAGNGFLTFSTDHFSYYVIAGTGDSIILDTKNYQMPVNGSYQVGVKLTGGKAASMKVYPDNSKTAAVTKLANGNYRVTGKNPGTVYIMYDVYDNKNKLLTHASVRVDVKTGIRPRGDSARQYGVY